MNIDYIIETYCVNKEKPKLQCNGKCHLAGNLALSTSSSDTENTSFFSAFYEAFIPVYFQESKSDFLLLQSSIPIDNNWKYRSVLTLMSKEIIDPPPQFL